jgi:hypothetical protein
MVFKHFPLLLSLVAAVVSLLAACANSPTGQGLAGSLAPDPSLQNNPNLFGNPGNAGTDSPQTIAKLPSNFPDEIPRYQNATLNSAENTGDGQGGSTQWNSPDRSDRILSFYQNEFQSGDWQVERRPDDDLQGTFVARKATLQVTVSIEPQTTQTLPSSPSSPNPSPTAPATETSGTTFSIQYIRDANAAPFQTGDSEFIGPPVPSGVAVSPQPSVTQATMTPQPVPNLNAVPQELQQYISDLTQLEVLPAGSALQPNQTITRREFIRWLMTANNQIYINRPALRIRLASEADQPVFKDVPQRDPDFAVIQGAAEAGIIPSSLAGGSTNVLFYPNAPLTRETLIQWKVPLDTRQTLPTATTEGVKQVWGFQDAARIDPQALRAILADHQNGDLANIRRAFGYTALFQPKRSVTQAEALAALWYIGYQGAGISAQDALQARATSTAAQSNSPVQTSPTASPIEPTGGR